MDTSCNLTLLFLPPSWSAMFILNTYELVMTSGVLGFRATASSSD